MRRPRFVSLSLRLAASFIAILLLIIISQTSAHASTFTIANGNSSAFQTALDQAHFGDTIYLTPGPLQFVGPFILKNNKGAGTGTDADYITITSSGAVPQAGGRVSPEMASQMNFPKIVSPGGNQEAIVTAAGAHHYQFIGVEIVSKNDGQSLNTLISLGEGVSGGHYVQDRLELVPHHLIIDRCYIHANDGQEVIRGVALNSAETSIINSYISNFKSKNEGSTDSQAVWGWNGPGSFKIENNYLEGSGERYCLR